MSEFAADRMRTDDDAASMILQFALRPACWELLERSTGQTQPLAQALAQGHARRDLSFVMNTGHDSRDRYLGRLGRPNLGVTSHVSNSLENRRTNRAFLNLAMYEHPGTYCTTEFDQTIWCFVFLIIPFHLLVPLGAPGFVNGVIVDAGPLGAPLLLNLIGGRQFLKYSPGLPTRKRLIPQVFTQFETEVIHADVALFAPAPPLPVNGVIAANHVAAMGHEYVFDDTLAGFRLMNLQIAINKRGIRDNARPAV